MEWNELYFILGIEMTQAIFVQVDTLGAGDANDQGFFLFAEAISIVPDNQSLLVHIKSLAAPSISTVL